MASLGGLALWSISAPLASAAMARGTVVVESGRKTLQHLDGGEITAIHVREGDKVVEDQVLVSLSEHRLALARRTLLPLVTANAALRVRLQSERVGADELPALDEREYPGAEEALREQRRMFQARRDAFQVRLRVLRGEAELYHEQSRALRQQMKFQSQRVVLTEEELRNLRALQVSGVASLRQVANVQKTFADMQAELTRIEAAASEMERRADQASLSGQQAKAVFAEAVEGELQATENQRLELSERLSATTEQMRRLQLRAPAAGTVVGLAVQTVGAILQPGTTVLEIVPDSESLVIDAHVKPADIERVRPGHMAEIRVTGVDGGLMPRLHGIVTLVSADAFRDRVRGREYFLVRVQTTEGARDILRDRFSLRPGMEVDVMILRGEHTLIEYLTAPISAFLSDALRE